MTRCNSCNGIITKRDLKECYLCGDSIPGAPKQVWRTLARFLTKQGSSLTRDETARNRVMGAGATLFR
jgi:hypothetical protein